jgi:hypothetical protein
MATGKFVGRKRTCDSAPRDPASGVGPKDKAGEPISTNPVAGSRRWIKLWVEPWFKGTVRFTLDHRERAVWIDLLAMAGQSRFPGVICAGIENGPLVGFPLRYIAGQVDVPEDDLKQMFAKFEAQGRISIRRDERDRLIITVKNWQKYQADYSKQARYRAKKKNALK